MDKNIVCVRAVSAYEQDKVDAAIKSMIDALGGIEKFIRKGQIVLLKPNLVTGSEPQKATTTHPAVVASVAKLCKDAGASRVIIADSPGGPYNKGYVNGIYKKTEMTKAAEYAGAELNQDFTETQVEYPNGVMAKKIPLCTCLEKADVIINIAKMKTHAFAGISAACKNLYGAIPGLVKVEWHQYFQDLNTFADCLLDIQGYLAPKLRLHIVDAIEAMEGPGPTSGTPVHVGLLLASECFTSTDIVCTKLMGENPSVMPTITRAADRGFINKNLDIEIEGEDISGYINQKYKKTAPSTYSATGKKKITQWFIKKVFSQKPKVSRRKCKGCAKCKEHCPVEAITMKPRGGKSFAAFDYNKCIRCFCCQELCPFHLVKVKTPIVVKVMNSSKARRIRKQAKTTQKK